MQPYLLEIVHEMSGDGLQPKEEKGESHIDNDPRHNLEEGFDSVEGTLILNRYKSDHIRAAVTVVDYFAVGVG